MEKKHLYKQNAPYGWIVKSLLTQAPWSSFSLLLSLLFISSSYNSEFTPFDGAELSGLATTYKVLANKQDYVGWKDTGLWLDLEWLDGCAHHWNTTWSKHSQGHRHFCVPGNN